MLTPAVPAAEYSANSSVSSKRIVFFPLAFQPDFPGSQIEVAHCNAHVDALQVGLSEETVEHPLPITRRAPQIKMPAPTLANDPPGLLFEADGASRIISRGRAYSPAAWRGRGLPNLSSKKSRSQLKRRSPWLPCG